MQKLRAWLEQQDREAEQIKARLAAEHGIPRDAKFDKAWRIAWSLGHSSGFSEVEYYFSEIVELIKP
jgi:hypothetical protein